MVSDYLVGVIFVCICDVYDNAQGKLHVASLHRVPLMLTKVLPTVPAHLLAPSGFCAFSILLLEGAKTSCVAVFVLVSLT